MYQSKCSTSNDTDVTKLMI